VLGGDRRPRGFEIGRGARHQHDVATFFSQGLGAGSPEVKRFIRLLVAHKTVIDPTIHLYSGMFTARQGQVSPDCTPFADNLPVQVRRICLTGGLPVPDGMDATYRASWEQNKKLLKALWDAGVRIVAGTDSFAGFTLLRELEFDEEAGIPPADVLALATIGAARVMKHDKEWGAIAPGKLADLVLVDGQPDVHVSDLRKAVTVVKGGTLYPCADLRAAIGVH